MADEESKQRLAAIINADVVGYSRLLSQDRVATVQTLKAHRAMFADFAKRYGGRIVDTPGDNILAVLESISDAVNCAVEIQRELAERNAEIPSARMMQWRIGIELGDIVKEGDNVYGDGVNISKRVQDLAEPGGICISGKVYDQVQDKLGLEYDSLDEHDVKNIAKPVRVYRVLSYPGAAAHRVIKAKGDVTRRWHKVTLAAVAVAVLCIGFVYMWNYLERREEPSGVNEPKSAVTPPEKPSIAVLPFDNMSRDPDQEYFADGMTEEIITRLSENPTLTVIARNSTFFYKGKQMRLRQIGRDLAARYIVEGSVRKTGNMVRITAQLIDAETEGHLWARTYDRELREIFTLQDEIAHEIVTSMSAQGIVMAERARVKRIPTDNLTAYDYVVRGMELSAKLTDEGNSQARELYKKAIELDPEYALAHVRLGHTYWLEYAMSWTRDPQLLEQAYDIAKRAEALDPVSAYALMANVYSSKGQFHQAEAEARKALERYPNNADAHALMGGILNGVGKPEEAIARLDEAIRLNPKHGAPYFTALAWSYLRTDRANDAISVLENARSLDPEWEMTYRCLLIAYRLFGRPRDAIEVVEEAISRNPSWPMTQSLLAHAYRDSGRYDEAITSFRDVLSRKPDYWIDSPFCLVWAYAFQWETQQNEDPNALDKALEVANSCLSLSKEKDQFYCYAALSTIHLLKKQYRLATENAEKMVPTQTEEPDRNGYLASIYLSLERSNEAIAFAKKALDLGNTRDLTWLLCVIGRAERALGRQTEAAETLNRVFDSNPWHIASFHAHANLAILHSESGRLKEARAHAAEILKLAPNFSVEVWGERNPMKDREQVKRDMAALRKAGLPD